MTRDATSDVAGVAIAPLGDAAVLLTLGDHVDLALNRRVHRVARAVRGASISAVVDVVPAYATLSVHYDPLYVSHDALCAQLRDIATAALADDAPDEASDATTHTLRVHYDGPDLDDVARHTGLARDRVIALHAHTTYTVYLLGFVPGFAYLGDLDARLALPRRSSPRTRVPAGAVAIAGRQTAVYPLATPGGWHLIGRCDATLLDVARAQPALLAPGDRVRFEPA